MKSGIIRSISVVFFLSVLAKIIAFIKSMVQAFYFGATIETDAYNMAYSLESNILFMLSTAIMVAFVPIYTQKKTQPLQAFKFSTKIITALSIFAVLFTLVLETGAPLMIRLTAPAYKNGIFQDTVSYFRALLPGFVFSFVAGVYQTILNAERIYGYANFSSIINSIALILITVLASARIGIWALVISVPLSYLFQFLMVYIRGRKYGIISLRYGLKDESVRTLLVLAMPILFSQATVEINQIVDRMLLTSVAEGAVTSVSYAVVLYQFVMHIINIPISTVMFTELSEAGVEKDYGMMRELLTDSYKVIFIICLPVVVIVSFLSNEVVAIVYGRGKFEAQAVRQTAAGLFGYIHCLIPVAIKSVLTRAYYGLNDTKNPMVIGLLEVALNIALSVLLAKKSGILGIVGATAIASMVFTVVMLVDFERRYFRVLYWKSILGCWKVAVGGMAASILLWFLRELTVVNIYVDFAVKGVAVFATYFFILFIIRESNVLRAIEWVKERLGGGENG